MATELIATGTTAASSADITVVEGAAATVALKDANGARMGLSALVYIEIKDDAGGYTTFDILTSDHPARRIVAAGTYRLRREANGPAVGAFQG